MIPGSSSDAYCPAHQPVLDHGWDTSQRVKPKGWERTRKIVLRRSGGRCVLCGRRATVVDHLMPQAWGGSDSMDNLRGLCRRHHDAKTQDEAILGRSFARLGLADRQHAIQGFLSRWH